MFKQYRYSEIENVVFELLNDKAVIISTDTIMGILSKNLNLIYEIKQRPKSKPIIIFLPDHSYLTNLDHVQTQFIDEFWPGQVTIIKNNISYRIPDDKYLLYILNKVGPLYCSSANISDSPVIHHSSEANLMFDVNKYFYNLILVNSKEQSNLPSTIVDIDKWEIKRQGANIDAVEKFISNMKKQSRNINVLIDKIWWDKNKLIKKELNDSSIKFLKLSSANLYKILKNTNFLSEDSDLLILTNTPDEYDVISNKLKYIRSGIIYNTEMAPLLKKHDNTNVAIFDLELFSLDEVINQMKLYINETFEGGRHQERVQTIIDYENEEN